MKDLYIFTYGTLKRGFVNNYFLDDAIFTKFTPSEQDIKKAKELGKKLAQLVKENTVDE